MTSAKRHARAGAPVASFFKTMNKSFLAQAPYMPIPEAFYNQHKEVFLKEGVTLEGAAGKEWEVEVASGAFRAGWKAFSSDNGLKENDTVVFRCCGDRRMSFEVFSFDGCEKQQPVATVQPNGKRSKGLDELAREAAYRSKRARPSTSSGKQQGRTTVDSEQVSADDDDNDSACHAKKALESDFTAAAAADGQAKQVQQVIVGVDDDTEIQIVIKKLRKTSRVEAPEASADAGPAAAAKSKRKPEIEGLATAKSKPPTASRAPVRKASAEKTPDVPAGTRAKDKAPASKASVPAAGGSKPQRRISKRPATAKAKTNSRVTLSKARKSSIKKASSAQAAGKPTDEYAQVVISDDESQPEQEPQRKKSKSDKPNSPAESLAKASAEALKTNKPSTVIVMKKSNLQPCFYLGIPSAFAKKNMPDEISEFDMVDAADKAWSVRWLGSPKCAFSGGWCYFAQDHNLHMGDACVLELAGPGRIRMHIFKVSDFVTGTAVNQQPLELPVEEALAEAVAHEGEREGATAGQVADEREGTPAGPVGDEVVAAVVEEDDEGVVTVAAAAAAEAAEAAEAVEAAEEEDEHEDGDDDEDYDPMEDSPATEDSPAVSNAVENGEDIE